MSNDRPTPTEQWLAAMGLEVAEAYSGPGDNCPVCAATHGIRPDRAA